MSQRPGPTVLTDVANLPHWLHGFGHLRVTVAGENRTEAHGSRSSEKLWSWFFLDMHHGYWNGLLLLVLTH